MIKQSSIDENCCFANTSLVFSFSDFSFRGYPAVYPIKDFNDDLTEEEIFTDDSSDTGDEDTVSGSESEEDPTFMLDASCSQDPDTQVSI